MSEIQAQPAVRDNTPGSGTPAASGEPQEESKSFWQVAGTAFRSRIANLVALSWIGFLLFMAIFVPFIASGHPYTIEILEKEAWVRHWPLFDNLARLDYVLLIAFAGAVTYFFIYRSERNVGEREERMARRVWWLGAVSACTLAVILSLTFPVWAPYVMKGAAPLWAGFTGKVLSLRFLFSLLGSLLLVTIILGAGYGIFRILLRNGLKISVILLIALAAGATCGRILDPGVKLSPYDYRAYQEMLNNGTARAAVFAPIHWSFNEQEPLMKARTFEFPSRDHWLGTDGIGRDALSRLLWSMRVVMGIGFVAESIALLIGILVGSVMGYFAGKLDLLGMRLVEIFESIPVFILILIFVAAYGRDLFIIMVILGFTGWTGIARFVRAEFLRLRKLDYVQAATALGLPVRRILFRHMLPNGLTPVIVTATFGVAGAIMSESGLSFLGVGVEPPTPSWGSMLNEAGNPAETFRWWLAIAPGVMIFMTVLAYNIIGEGLRDAIDPRLNKVR